MTEASQSIISVFDGLPPADKHAVAVAILQRVCSQEYPPLTDDELTAIAEDRFLTLDDEEQARAESEPR